MVSTNNLKNGMTLRIDDKLWKVEYFQHVKPGKGPAFVRTKLKGIPDGKNVDRTFRAGEELEQAIVTRSTLQYLYQEGRRVCVHGHQYLRPDQCECRDHQRCHEVAQGERNGRTRLL